MCSLHTKQPASTAGSGLAACSAGKNIKVLVDKGEQPHCLRLQKNRVFYVREDLMRRATNVSLAGCAVSETTARCWSPGLLVWCPLLDGMMRSSEPVCACHGARCSCSWFSAARAPAAA